MIKKAFALIVVILFVCIGFIGCEKHKYLDYEVVDIIDEKKTEVEPIRLQLELINSKEELDAAATILDYRQYPDQTATYTLYIINDYDEVFFEDYSLILFQLHIPTPKSKSSLDSIEIKDNIIVVNSRYELYTAGIQVEGPWHIEVIKIKKSDIQGVIGIKENRTKKYI